MKATTNYREKGVLFSVGSSTVKNRSEASNEKWFEREALTAQCFELWSSGFLTLTLYFEGIGFDQRRLRLSTVFHFTHDHHRPRKLAFL